MKLIDNFCIKLDEMDFHYKRETTENGRELLRLGLSGDHFTGLMVYVLFQSDT